MDSGLARQRGWLVVQLRYPENETRVVTARYGRSREGAYRAFRVRAFTFPASALNGEKIALQDIQCRPAGGCGVNA